MFSLRMRPVLVALAVLSFATTGCQANRPPLTCPGKGGPAWVQVRSPHFVVQTDLPVETAREIAADVETSRAALIAAMGAPPDDAAVPVQVVVFGRLADFEVIGPASASGVFSARLWADFELQPLIVTEGGLDYASRTTLQHELVHHIVRRRTTRIPWWLDEGLAELYSTLRVEDGEIIVGEPPKDADFWEQVYVLTEWQPAVSKLWIPVGHAPSLDRLLSVDRIAVDESGARSTHYAASWKLMHALRGHTDGRLAPRFSAMMAALMSGTDGAVAFARAYKGILMSEISDRYEKLLTDHREYPRRMPFESPKRIELSAAVLGDDEVHALWARLLASFAGGQVSPDEEIERGLAETPGSPHLLHARACVLLQQGRAAEAKKDIRLLLQADASNPRNLLLDLQLAIDAYSEAMNAKDPAARQVRRRELASRVDRLEAVAATPAQRATTAFALMLLERVAEASVLARKAVEMAPSCDACFFIHATLLYFERRLPEARAAAERALALIPEGASLTKAKELFAEIDKALEAEKAASEPKATSP